MLAILETVPRCDKCERVIERLEPVFSESLTQLLTLVCFLKFLALSLSGVNCLAYDEAIIAQQDRIQQEVRKH